MLQVKIRIDTIICRQLDEIHILVFDWFLDISVVPIHKNLMNEQIGIIINNYCYIPWNHFRSLLYFTPRLVCINRLSTAWWLSVSHFNEIFRLSLKVALKIETPFSVDICSHCYIYRHFLSYIDHFSPVNIEKF